MFAYACGGDDDINGAGPETPAFGLTAETVASGGIADNVSAIEFAPDGRIFYAEQFRPDTSDGSTSAADIRIINADGTPQQSPFVEMRVADYLGLDWGLTGLALDPDFATNHYVYAFYTELVTADGPIARPRIVRWTESDGAATEETLISDQFPDTVAGKQGYNANGELHFGPDGMLYASVGDYDLFGDQPDVVRGRDNPIGKLLRMNPDGSAPDDNPFAGQEGIDERIFATGFREPFAFAFDPQTGDIYGTDNTTVSCEELNLIEAGEDYGWPAGSFPFDDCGVGEGTAAIGHLPREGLEPQQFLSFTEVAGLSFLQGSTYTQLTDGLMVCESQKSKGPNDELTRGVLRRVVLSDSGIGASEVIVHDCKGEVRVSPDGTVYYSNASEIKRLTQGQQAPAAGS